MKVFIGVDPHKLSVTVEVVDVRETVLATGRFRTDGTGYAAMRKQEDAADLAAQDILIAARLQLPTPGREPVAVPPRRHSRVRVSWASSTRVRRWACRGGSRQWRVLVGPRRTGQARAGVGHASAVTVVSDGIRIHRIG